MNITENIIAARKAKRVTKQQIADYLGCTPQNYYNMEARGANVSLNNLNRIAAAIGVSISELIGEQVNEAQAKEIETLKARIRELEMDKTIYAQMISSLQNSKQ